MAKEIKIGYRNYKIKNLDSIVSKCNEINGQFLATDGVIALSSDEDSIPHANTLIHEIFHAIVYQWGIELDDKEEEKICNTLANGLTTVLVDNPWLLPYIQKNLKGEK
jgi:hypothetical protein